MPEMEEWRVQNYIVLAFKEDVEHLLKEDIYEDDDILHLMKAVKILRKEFFTDTYQFSGVFEPDCEKHNPQHASPEALSSTWLQSCQHMKC